jgi:hypothetical protein
MPREMAGSSKRPDMGLADGICKIDEQVKTAIKKNSAHDFLETQSWAP